MKMGQQAMAFPTPQPTRPTQAPTFSGKAFPIDTRRYNSSSIKASIKKLGDVCRAKDTLEKKKREANPVANLMGG